MNKNSYVLLIALAVLALIVANWKKIQAFLQNGAKADPSIDGNALTTGGTTTPKNVPVGTGQAQYTAMQVYNNLPGSPSASRTLSRGTTNSKSVFILQALLNSQFNKNLTLDGDFGGGTETALKSVLGKNSTTLAEFVNTKVSANSPAIALLNQYGVSGLTGYTGAYQSSADNSSSSVSIWNHINPWGA